jgi:hypothetical protein
MGKNQQHKARQSAKRSGTSGAGGEELPDTTQGVDASFHTAEWHAARLQSLQVERPSWEDWKQKQAEEAAKEDAEAHEQARLMAEYKQGLEADRARRLGLSKGSGSGGGDKKVTKKKRKHGSKDKEKEKDKKRRKSSSKRKEKKRRKGDEDRKHHRSKSNRRRRSGSQSGSDTTRSTTSSTSDAGSGRSNSSNSDKDGEADGRAAGPIKLSKFLYG